MAQETMTIVINADDNASGVIGNIGKSLGSLGGAAQATVAGLTTATVAAVGGLAAAIGVGVGKAADLEQGVADIAAVMGLAANEVAPLNDLIQDLGMDPKLKVNATEASDAIMQLAQSGISMSDIMDGAARNVVLLSNATGGDMALSAAIASDAMTLFNISASDMERAVNQITGVTVASKFGIVDYQYALANVGGVASTLGVSFEDLNTSIAAISPSFASGQEAGTALKTLFTRMVPASDDAADAMRDIGLFTGLTAKEMEDAQKESAKLQAKIAALDPTSADFADQSARLNQQLSIVNQSMVEGQNAFFNADGSMKSMAEIAGILQNAISGLSAEQQSATLTTIFSSDAIRAATALSRVGSAAFTELAGSIAQVDAGESASTRMNTFSGAMEVLQGVLDGLMIGIGDAFLPMLRSLVGVVTELANTHGPAVISMFKNFADQITVTSTWLAETFRTGNLLNESITRLNPNIQSFILLISGLIQPLQSLFVFISDLIVKHNLWKDILIGLGIVIAAVVIPTVLTLITTLAPIIAAVVAVVAIIHLLRMAFESNFGGIRDFVTSALSIVIDTFTQVQNGTITLQEGIGRVFNGIVNLVREYLPQWQAMLASWANAVWQWIVNATPVVLAKLNEWRIQLLNWLGQNLPIWMAKLGEWAGAIWQWIVNATPVVLAKLNEWRVQLLNWLGQNLPGWMAKLGEWAGAIWQWIVSAIPVVLDKLALWGSRLLLWLGQNLPGWMARLGEWAGAIWQWIVDATPVVLAKLAEWGAQLFNWLGQNLPGWISRLSVWAGAIWQWIVNATPVVIAKLTEWGSQLFSWLSTNLPGWIAKLAEWATAIWQWIVNVTPIVVAKLAEWGRQLLNWLGQNLPGWIAKLAEWATAIWQWIVDVTPTVIAKLAEWGEQLLAWLGTNLPGWVAKLAEWATAIWQWIVDVTPTVIAKLAEWGGQLLAWLGTNLPGWVAKLAEWATAIWQWIVDVTPTVIAKLAEWGGQLLAWLGTNLPGWVAKLAEWATAIWQWIVDATSVAVEKLSFFGGRLINQLMVGLPGWKTQLGTWATAIWQWIVDAVPLAVAEMGKWGAALIKWLTDNLPGWLTEAGKWVSGLTSSFATGILNGLPNIQTEAGKIWTALNNEFGLADKLASAKNWGTVLFNNLRDGIAASDGTVQGAALAIWNVLRDMFGIDAKLANAKAWGTNVITNLATGISEAIETIKTETGKIWNAVRNEITLNLNLFQLGTNIINGLANGIISTLQGLMMVGSGGIWDIFSKLLTFIRGFFEEASPSKVMMRLGKNVMLGMEIGMAENIPDMSKNPKLQKLATEMTGTVSSGIAGGLGDVDRAAQQVIETFKSKLSTSEFLAIGTNLINAIIAGFTRGISSSGNAAQQLVDSFKNRLSASEFLAIGTNLIDSAIAGLTRGANGSSNAAQQLINAFRNRLSANEFINIGGSLIDGLNRGIQEKINWLTSNVINGLSWIIEQIRRIFRISSPSKVMENLGRDLMLGMEQGMLKNIPAVLNAAQSMASGVMHATDNLALAPQLSLPSIGTPSNRDMTRPNVTTNNMTYNLSYQTMRSAESIEQDVALLNLLYGSLI